MAFSTDTFCLYLSLALNASKQSRRQSTDIFFFLGGGGGGGGVGPSGGRADKTSADALKSAFFIYMLCMSSCRTSLRLFRDHTCVTSIGSAVFSGEPIWDVEKGRPNPDAIQPPIALCISKSRAIHQVISVTFQYDTIFMNPQKRNWDHIQDMLCLSINTVYVVHD